MLKLVAALPLAGFFLGLTAYWCWNLAREAGINADLQKRLWDHNKYQRDYGEQTPLDVSEWLQQQKARYRWLSLLLTLLAAACFAYAFVNLNTVLR